MNYNFYKLYVIEYIMSFRNISSEEHDRLIKNKNRIFDMTFKNPEILNKYRNDKNIYNEIKQNEKQNKKLEKYDKIFHGNLDLLKMRIKRKLKKFLHIIII